MDYLVYYKIKHLELLISSFCNQLFENNYSNKLWILTNKQVGFCKTNEKMESMSNVFHFNLIKCSRYK